MAAKDKSKLVRWRSPLLLASGALALFLLVIGNAYIGQVNRQSSPLESRAISTPTPYLPPRADLPRLYPNIEWKPPEEREIAAYQDKPFGPVVVEGIHRESVVLSSYPADFIEYYKEELAKRGWTQTASTTGGIGEIYSYEQNGRYVSFGVFSFRSRSEFRAFVGHN